MNLKSVLKLLKLNESTISMILGALVIIVVGMLVVNYFRSNEPGTTFPNGASTEEPITLPTTHTVAEGENLWSISEKYYNSGYNWVDIAEANNLTSADVISAGQELTIPDVEAKTAEVEPRPEDDQPLAETASPEATPTVAPTEAPLATLTPSPTATPTLEPRPEGDQPLAEIAEPDPAEESITADEYTVVHGDTLWDIAARAYGDPYKWVEIAEANDLANPDLIHPGNVFVLPR